MKKIMIFVFLMMMSFQLYAIDFELTPVAERIRRGYESILVGGKLVPNAGDHVVWAGGTLTRKSKDGPIEYVKTGPPEIRVELTSGNLAGLKDLSNRVPEVKKFFEDGHGVDLNKGEVNYKLTAASINTLLSSAGPKDGTLLIEGTDDRVLYDKNGRAKCILLPASESGVVSAAQECPGTGRMSIGEYLGSNRFKAAAGLVDNSGPAAITADLSFSNDVNSDIACVSGTQNSDVFNGDVKALSYNTTDANGAGVLDMLLDQKGVPIVGKKGGRFCRSFNGIDGLYPEVSPLPTDRDYENGNLDVITQVWGITEIGEKMCKPIAGYDYPTSLVNWWVILKNYVAAEKARNALYNKRRSDMCASSRKISDKKEFTKEFCDLPSRFNTYFKLPLEERIAGIEGAKLHIESMNIEIDTISGSSLYEGGATTFTDKLATQVRATSRIAWREKMLAAALAGLQDNLKEDIKMSDAWDNCSLAAETSLDVAKRGFTKFDSQYSVFIAICNNPPKKIVQGPIDPATNQPTSMEVVDEDKKKIACDTAKLWLDKRDLAKEMIDADIPIFKQMSLEDLKKLRNVALIPSKEVNERFARILGFINKQVNVLFPRSQDEFDWIAPLASCIQPLERAFKSTGMICPANAKDGPVGIGDYQKSSFDFLGKSDDLLTELNHYAVGENFPPSSPGYAWAKATYDGGFKEAGKDAAATVEDKHNAGERRLWIDTVNGKYSKNFLLKSAGLPPRVFTDAENAEERKYAEGLMKENNLTSTECSKTTCVPPPAARVAAPTFVTPEQLKEITKRSEAFLESVGLSANSNDINFLTSKWNIIDLYIGHPGVLPPGGNIEHAVGRYAYFNYNIKILQDMILADRAKLGRYIASRNQAIDFYNQLIAELNKKTNSGTTTDKVSVTADPTTKSTGGAVPNSGGVPRNRTSGNTTNLGGHRQSATIDGSGVVSYNGIATNKALNRQNDPTGKGNGGSLSTGRDISEKNQRKGGRTFSATQGPKIDQLRKDIQKLSSQYDKNARGRNGLASLDKNNSQLKNMEASFRSILPANSKLGSMLSTGAGSNAIKSDSGLGGAAEKSKYSTNSNSSGGGYDGGSSGGYGGGYGGSSGGNGFGSSSSGSSSSYGKNNLQNSGSLSGLKAIGGSGGISKYSNLTTAEIGKLMNSPAWAKLSEDEKKILEAIYARDQYSKSKFRTQPDDSLFEIITKAHIRNYQRIEN